MYICQCDICNTIIKNGDVKFSVVSRQAVQVETKDYKDANEYMRDAQRTYSGLKVQEICENCHKAYEAFFKLRKEDVDKILEEIEKTWQTKRKTFIKTKKRKATKKGKGDTK